MIEDADSRRRELATIHLGAKALGMDDACYRDMLFALARVRSAADLDFAGRRRVIEHLRASGFKANARRPNPQWAWVDRAAADRQPLLRKIIMQLKSAGRAKQYADGVCRRMFNVERLEFCAADQLHKIVSALQFDAGRRSNKGERSCGLP